MKWHVVVHQRLGSGRKIARAAHAPRAGLGNFQRSRFKEEVIWLGAVTVQGRCEQNMVIGPDPACQMILSDPQLLL